MYMSTHKLIIVTVVHTYIVNRGQLGHIMDTFAYAVLCDEQIAN